MDARTEPEVDLSSVFAKARIDHAAAQDRSHPAANQDDDDDNDVDTTLAHLHDRDRERRRQHDGPRRPTHSVTAAPAGYEEALAANRAVAERGDARLRRWGQMEAGLKQRADVGKGRGGIGATKEDKGEKQPATLEGQDFLDSMLA